MRTLYRIDVPHFYQKSHGLGYINYEVDFITSYLVHAESVEDAISKLPPGEDKSKISKVECFGSFFVIL